jgi:ParB/RepB/Spo0J family partition protein
VKTEDASERNSAASKTLWGEKAVRPLNVQTRLDTGQLVDLALDSLEDSPFQVKQYDDARVRDLAETIRCQGLLQPATVRRVGSKYQLISGHARRTAIRLLRDKVATSAEEKARYSTIRCVLLLDVDDARAAALTAIENLQRDDGTPLEQAMMVARARKAGNYQSVAETSEALGLPRGRVRQYLELADAPEVLQRAVSPGVLLASEEGGRERVPFPITNVLGARSYYDFLLNNRLAELRAEGAVQKRRDERRGRVDDSADGKARETARQQAEAAEFAAEKTERLLVRAARQAWTGAELQAHVRTATKPESVSSKDSDGCGPDAVSSPLVARLYEDKGGRFTLWPQAIPTAAAGDRSALAARLRTFLQQLEG